MRDDRSLAADTDPAALVELPRLALRYHIGELSAAEYAGCYVLHWQFARRGKNFAQRRSRSDAKPDGLAWFACIDAAPGGSSGSECGALLLEFLARYDLRGLRRRVNLALIGWLRGTWPLTLCESVPAVSDVLGMQVRDTRPVTAIADYPRLLEPVREKPDAFAFICHDLEHAWQFFHDPEQHQAQRHFAQRLERAIERGVFAPYVKDSVFARKFDYLAADMNTHVMHSVQYLRAILIEFHLSAEGKGPREQLAPESRARLSRCLAAVGADSAWAAMLREKSSGSPASDNFRHVLGNPIAAPEEFSKRQESIGNK